MELLNGLIRTIEWVMLNWKDEEYSYAICLQQEEIA